MRRSSSLFVFLAVIAVALLWSSLLAAEEISLKDGTKISGKIVGVSGDTFQVTTAYGEIKVPRAQIVTISFPENQPKTAEADEVPAIDESLTGTNYVNKTVGFQATVPSGWALAPELRKTKDIAAALKAPDETQFFLVTPEVFAGTLATYKVLAETQYKSKFSDYEKISETEAKIDGRDGLRFVFHGKPDQTTPMKCLVYMIPYEGRMVRLSFLTLDELFNDDVPTFEKIAASYHFTGTTLAK